MAGELNSIQESIKLALDAADAATDVTSEYSQVKRETKKLERKVSQIHRYTTITFVSAVVAAVAGLSFSALLYFKTLSELRLMSTTNREGLVVFAENIEQLNSVLSELNVALDQQEELVALNRESSEKMTQLMTLISSTSEATINELQASTSAMRESNAAIAGQIGEKLLDQTVGQNNGIAVKLAAIESSLSKSINKIEKKLINPAELGALSAAQANTSGTVEMLAGQNVKILKLLEVQQDRISFPTNREGLVVFAENIEQLNQIEHANIIVRYIVPICDLPRVALI